MMTATQPTPILSGDRWRRGPMTTGRSLLLGLLIAAIGIGPALDWTGGGIASQARAQSADDSDTPETAPESVEEAGPTVATTKGSVRGAWAGDRDGVATFKGVPFAAPPIGENRWRAPQPVEPWEGVRDATAFGPSCPQPQRDRSIGLPEVEGEQSEDCLYLNVFTPAAALSARDDDDDDDDDAAEASEGRPVMVWIHGGGMTVGSGRLPTYDGTQLAQSHDVIVVTINYRLGILGFFAHAGLAEENEAGLAGNYGLLDQIQALEWVRDEIRAFGGDPDNVTIFGESAGSVSVSLLMVSPRAEGLFHRAIMQSGIGTSIRESLDEAMATGATLAERLGVAADDEDPIATLRGMSARALVDGIPTQLGLYSPGQSYGPIIDGEGGALPADPLLMWREGRQHDVPIIAGANRDEGTIFIQDRMIPTEQALRAVIRQLAGPHANELLELYPLGETTPREIWNQITTDYAFLAPSRLVVRWHAAHKQSASRLYFFTHVLPFPRTRALGAFHALEIPFVFDNLPTILRRGGGDELADAMSAAWTSFATTGTPTMPGTDPWPAWSDEARPFYEFGTRRIQPSERLREDRLNLMEKIIAHHRNWDSTDAITPDAGEPADGADEAEGSEPEGPADGE